MSASSRSRTAKRAGATVLLSAGLVAGGYAVASAASGPSTTAPTAPGTSPPAPNPTTPNSPAPYPKGKLPGPGGAFRWFIGGGQVTSVSPTSLTVTGPDGTSRTFTLTSATKYTKDGAPASYGDLARGERVMVKPTAPPSPGTNPSTAPMTAAEVNIVSPGLAGKVVSVSGAVGAQTIVVSDQEGFWRTIKTSSSTTYTDNGKTVSVPSIATGAELMALGTVAADHTTLDASQVIIGAANGNFGFPGHAGMSFGPSPLPPGSGPRWGPPDGQSETFSAA